MNIYIVRMNEVDKPYIVKADSMSQGIKKAKEIAYIDDIEPTLKDIKLSSKLSDIKYDKCGEVILEVQRQTSFLVELILVGLI